MTAVVAAPNNERIARRFTGPILASPKFSYSFFAHNFADVLLAERARIPNKRAEILIVGKTRLLRFSLSE